MNDEEDQSRKDRRMTRLAINPSNPPETWLDKMAGRALAGMLGDQRNLIQASGLVHTTDTFAKQAYDFAQAMLAEKRRIESEGTKEDKE